jgi:hypothetical protein
MNILNLLEKTLHSDSISKAGKQISKKRWFLTTYVQKCEFLERGLILLYMWNMEEV